MENGLLFAAFRAMWIKHPHADRVFSVCNDLRSGKRNTPPGTQQIAASLLAVSQSGKSRTVEFYIEKHIVDECYERQLFPRETPREIVIKLQRLVLYVPLSGGASVSSLLHDMLVAFGDPAPSRGTIPERRHRVLTLLRAYNVELIVIDEVQHLSTPSPIGPILKREEATNVQNNLKGFLLAGFPILFVGRPEARVKIFGDEQIDLRIEEEIKFGPLSFDKENDRKIVIDFCGRLGLKLKQHGIFKNEVDLIKNFIPAKLCEVSRGRLGVITSIVRHACKIAISTNDNTLTEKHLRIAAEKYVQKKLCSYNPFKSGVRPPKSASLDSAV